MTTNMIRPLVPAVAAALLALSLAGCSPAAPASDSPSTTDDGTSTSTSADGATGCELVTADMLSGILGVEPGEGVEAPSNIGGPASCSYADIFTDVQVTNDPDTYLSESALGIDTIEGAVEVPGADRGWASQGGFLIVKGGTGVFVTAFLNDSTADQWLELAEETLKKL